jgi:hypothetical protein
VVEHRAAADEQLAIVAMTAVVHAAARTPAGGK